MRRANIERVLAARERAGEDPEAERQLQDLLLQAGALRDREFEDLAEVFEDALWYGGNGSEGRSQITSGNFSGGELTAEQWLAFRRADQYPPFDIIVTFGDINNPAPNHSVVRMLDVSILGTEFEGIEPTGEPVVVRYDFIARTIA